MAMVTPSLLLPQPPNHQANLSSLNTHPNGASVGTTGWNEVLRHSFGAARFWVLEFVIPPCLFEKELKKSTSSVCLFAQTSSGSKWQTKNAKKQAAEDSQTTKTQGLGHKTHHAPFPICWKILLNGQMVGFRRLPFCTNLFRKLIKD